MEKSKLEMHVDVLEALAHHGKLELTQIMNEVNVSCNVLKGCLEVLIRFNLVEKQELDRKGQETRVVYAITERGLTAFKNAIEIDNSSPVVEEATTTSSLLQRVQGLQTHFATRYNLREMAPALNSCVNRLVGKAKNLFSVQDQKNREEPQAKPQERKEKGVSECSHQFGYLANRHKDTPIPEECLSCSKILDCMHT